MPTEAIARRHLRIGWWALLVFLSFGLALEGLHGFKIGLYLDVSNSTRREMWTLAHAHGTLLGLVNLAFGLCVPRFGPGRETLLEWASRALLAATILLPAGFFLGGVWIYGGDPGLGVLLVPIGAGFLLLSVLAAAWLSRGE